MLKMILGFQNCLLSFMRQNTCDNIVLRILMGELYMLPVLTAHA